MGKHPGGMFFLAQGPGVLVGTICVHKAGPAGVSWVLARPGLCTGAPND